LVSEAQGLQRLEEENRQPKQRLLQQALDIQPLKGSLRRKF
jgi:hypothetical protein